MYIKNKYKITRFWVAVTLIVIFDGTWIDASPGNIFDNFVDKIKSAISPSSKKNPTKDVCDTPGCLAAAKIILENMDKKIDPCDDFYHFACGNFQRETPIPDDRPNLSPFSIVSDMILDQLKAIISEPVADDDIKPFKQVKNMFNSCMNEEKIEKVGLTPMKNVFKKLGGWPALDDNWDEESFSCQEVIRKCREEGINADFLIHLNVNRNLKNTTTMMINIDQPSFGIDRKFLVLGQNDKIVDAYYKYIVDIAVIFGADRDHAAKELRQSLEFEINLANITLSPEQKKVAAKQYEVMSVVEAQRRFPVVSWQKYINTVLATTSTIAADETLFIGAPEYLTRLDGLLSVTPRRILANFFMSRIAGSMGLFLTKQVRDRLEKFSTQVTGRATQQHRWKECIYHSLGSFGVAIGSLYVRRYFDEESKKDALELTMGIRQEMYKKLSAVEWMDDDTRKQALDKAFSILNFIGYADELLENTKLITFYEKLETDPDNYLGSIMNVTKFWSDFNYSKLKKPINKTDWITHGAPTIVNAYYDCLENSLKFPAGILQYIFFSRDRPRYLNYGAVGFIIGHEITHGFDDQGRRFGKDGNFVDWWTRNTKIQFSAKARCFVEQTSNFALKGSSFKINGIQTLEEVIADNGGIGNAYYAYMEFIKKHGNETKLPDLLEYTQQQMFWIAAANVWCTKQRPESSQISIQNRIHPPGEFRVTGTFANQEEFARDFNCPVGSTMNPTSRCKIW